MKLILHFIFTCITCSFFPRELFISFGIIIIDSAIPSNLYLKSMCTTSEFCKGTSMSSVYIIYIYIFIYVYILIICMLLNDEFRVMDGSIFKHDRILDGFFQDFCAILIESHWKCQAIQMISYKQPKGISALLDIYKFLTLRAPRVLVPTPSTKGGSKRTPPPSILRTRNATNLKPLEELGVSLKVSKNFKLV